MLRGCWNKCRRYNIIDKIKNQFFRKRSIILGISIRRIRQGIKLIIIKRADSAANALILSCLIFVLIAAIDAKISYNILIFLSLYKVYAKIINISMEKIKTF